MTEPSHPATGRGGLAALTSALVPGWGHVLIGRRQLGRTLLIIDAFLVAIVLVSVLFLQVELVKAWVTPPALLAILGLNVGAMLYRGAVTVDSFAASPARNGVDWAVLAVALALVVAPHVLVWSLAVTQYDLIETVFAPEEPLAAPVAATAATTSLAEASTTTIVGRTTTAELPTTTTTAPPRIWDGLERLNLLLLGSDAGVGRIGTRTDTMILVSIDPDTGNVAMFSIPRNLTFAPLPEGMGLWDCQCFPDIITHLWANGEWYPEAFPGPQEPPINALKATVGLIFDVDVHYYAKVDLKGFVGIVDALGGVTVDLPERIVDPIYPHEDGGTEHLVFEPGVQHLDGHHALAYARIRRNSGDFARMHRQRCVLGAIVEQASPVSLVAGFSDLAAAVKENVVTDIPADRLRDFVALLPLISTDRIASLRITRYNYGVGGDNPGRQRYDLSQIRSDAKLLMADPTTALETLDGDGFDSTCDESFD